MMQSLGCIILRVEFSRCSDTVKDSILSIKFTNDKILQLEVGSDICNVSEFLIRERRCNEAVDLEKYSKENFELVCSLINTKSSADMSIRKFIEIVKLIEHLRLSTTEIHQNSIKALFRNLSSIVVNNINSKLFNLRDEDMENLAHHCKIIETLFREGIESIKEGFITDHEYLLFYEVFEYDDLDEKFIKTVFWFAKALNLSEILFLRKGVSKAHFLIFDPINLRTSSNSKNRILELLLKLEENDFKISSLDATNMPICYDDMMHIYSVTDIRVLRLRNSPSSKFTFQGIWSLEQLSVLEVSNFSVNSEDFFYLSELEEFGELILCDCSINNTNLRSLEETGSKYFPKLSRIELSNCDVDHDLFRFFKNLGRVKELKFKNSNLERCNINHVLNLPNLEFLELKQCSFSDREVGISINLPKLRHLNLSGIKLTTKIVSEILKVRNLKKLVLKDFNLTVDLLEQLISLPNLESIDVENNYAIKEEDVQYLIVKCRKGLEILN
ncbi:hypothetical protein P3W45_000878 [Vairimorpha bombi]